MYWALTFHFVCALPNSASHLAFVAVNSSCSAAFTTPYAFVPCLSVPAISLIFEIGSFNPYCLEIVAKQASQQSVMSCFLCNSISFTFLTYPFCSVSIANQLSLNTDISLLRSNNNIISPTKHKIHIIHQTFLQKICALKIPESACTKFLGNHSFFVFS